MLRVVPGRAPRSGTNARRKAQARHAFGGKHILHQLEARGIDIGVYLMRGGWPEAPGQLDANVPADLPDHNGLPTPRYRRQPEPQMVAFGYDLARLL